MFTSLIALSIFVIAVNTYGISKNKFIMFMGIGFAFIGVFDIIHTISYPGLGIIKYESVNIYLQSAFIGMYFEGIMFLFSYRLLKNDCSKFKPSMFFLSFFMCAAGLMFLMFYNNIFPDILNKFLQPTLFKILCQFFLLALFIISALLFYRIRKNIDFELFVYIEHALAARSISLLAFIISEPYNELSVIVHLAKLISFYFIYKAFVEIGLKNPFKYLYHKLAETSKELKSGNDKIREMESELLSNGDFYELLIENSNDIIIVHSEGNIIFANEKAISLLELKNINEIIGKNIDVFIDSENIDYVYECVRELYKTRKMIPFFEIKLISKSNKKIDVEAAGVYFVFNGKPAIAGIIRDISDKKQVEALTKNVVESNKLLNESREYNKLITEFMANISHELRTPLNVILSAVQVMHLSSLSNGEGKYLDVIKQNSYRLLKLVNNLIDISRINSGYLELSLNNYNIINVIEEITLSVAQYAEDRGLKLVFDTDEEERIIACDYDKVERIMLNLLSNAIKFTEKEDSIYVNITNEHNFVKISVRDTGIGIPEDKLHIIFERFMQVDKSFTRSHEGSGIGLALVKSLVEMHSGTIEVNSTLGEGTEFVVNLPADLIGSDFDKKSISSVNSSERVIIELSDIY